MKRAVWTASLQSAWIDSLGTLTMGSRFFSLPELCEHDSEIVMSERVVRIDFHRKLQLRLRILEIAQLVKGDAEVVVEAGIVRVH